MVFLKRKIFQNYFGIKSHVFFSSPSEVPKLQFGCRMNKQEPWALVLSLVTLTLGLPFSFQYLHISPYGWMIQSSEIMYNGNIL